MYDDCPKDINFWKQFSNFKIISFSEKLNSILQFAKLNTLYVKYYPKPVEVNFKNRNKTKGFFWERTSKIKWSILSKRIKESQLKEVHLHLAGDPGHNVEVSNDTSIKISVSNWFENINDLNLILDSCVFYFAPRLEEGIGMSFLEALSRGMCVVAPDMPTMNEYIVSGYNGILYNPFNNDIIDLSNVEFLCRNAYEDCIEGYDKWIKTLPEIKKFMESKTEIFYKRRIFFFFVKFSLNYFIDLLRKLKKAVKK